MSGICTNHTLIRTKGSINDRIIDLRTAYHKMNVCATARMSPIVAFRTIKAHRNTKEKYKDGGSDFSKTAVKHAPLVTPMSMIRRLAAPSP